MSELKEIPLDQVIRKVKTWMNDAEYEESNDMYSVYFTDHYDTTIKIPEKKTNIQGEKVSCGCLKTWLY